MSHGKRRLRTIAPFVRPTECQKEPATRADVRYAYRLLLGREPDPGGMRHYSQLLASDALSLDRLFELFIRSGEFQQRLNSLYAWKARAPEAIRLLDGTTIYVASDGDSDISGTIRSHRVYEPEVSMALRSQLFPGQCFVDVGASIGYFTVLASRAVGPAGRVIACEPGPQNLSMLLLNVLSNSSANVEVVPFALSDRREILGYSRLESNGAVSQVTSGEEALAAGDLIQAVPMDELLADNRQVDAIKVDVEGAEGKVFRGGYKTIERFRPLLFFEFTPSALEDVSGLSALGVLSSLEDLGYTFTVLTGSANDPSTARELRADDVLREFDSIGAQHIDIMAQARRD